MKLYLVRHGECVSPAIDPDQPLTDKGRRETEAVAKWLKPFHLEIDEIRHSVKTRARETAEILIQTIAPEKKLIQKEGLRPMDPIEPLLEEIFHADQKLMLVGHLPFMEKLITFLLFGEERESPVNLCTSCVVCLEGEGRHWKINWVVSPAMC